MKDGRKQLSSKDTSKSIFKSARASLERPFYRIVKALATDKVFQIKSKK